jgi:hypothetical protein
MAFSIANSLGTRFTTLLHSYAQDEGLPFASVLTEDQILQAATEEGVAFGDAPNAVYTPAITVWAFVGQVLAGRKSCVAAVARIIVLLAALRRPPCSSATGAYCQARAKLPESFLRRLTYQVGTELEDQAPAAWRWHDRRVLLADGTEIPLADTPENQAAFPQPTTQKPGLGFPMIRLVVLLAFATAGIVGASFGPYQGKETGETALVRQLFDRLRAGDVLVADRYYCSYFMIALLRPLGVDVVFRLHQKRHYDFHLGRHLGRHDHVVEWQRPQRPTWMDEATYATIPETLTVRELRFTIDQPGYRSRAMVVATTLIDERAYAKDDIADLYHQRWHAELDLRSIKQTLNMKELVCKTPAMVAKELWAHLLGYNLARKAAAQAAWIYGLCPRQLSFAGTVQTLEAFGSLLMTIEPALRWLVCQIVFETIAAHRVGDRPGRVEPRVRKRRYDKYPHLKRPRAEARAETINAAAA